MFKFKAVYEETERFLGAESQVSEIEKSLAVPIIDTLVPTGTYNVGDVIPITIAIINRNGIGIDNLNFTLNINNTNYSRTTDNEGLYTFNHTLVGEDNLDITRARSVLDDDHYGLEKVKERIIEYLAVLQVKKDMKGPILCFVGPPGVGKTSMSQASAILEASEHTAIMPSSEETAAISILQARLSMLHSQRTHRQSLPSQETSIRIGLLHVSSRTARAMC